MVNMNFENNLAPYEGGGGNLDNTIACTAGVNTAGFSPTLQGVTPDSDMSIIGVNGAALSTPDAIMNVNSVFEQSAGARRRRRGRKSKRSKKLRRSNKSRLSNKSKKSRSRSASRSKVKVSRKSLRKSKKRSKKSLK
jgi:hypothetical protein